MYQWFQLFWEQVKQTDARQWLAVIFGVAEVLLARVNNVLLYPAGIIATALSVYLLLDVKLYAESVLNIYYLVMSLYGWYHWVRKRNEPPVKITHASRSDWMVTLVISIFGWLIIYLVLKHYTPSDVPAIDAFVTSTAWAGMWLLARRKVENWLLLNISNIVAIPLLYHKGLAMFAVLTLILFIVAIFGYFDWRRMYRLEQAEQKSSS